MNNTNAGTWTWSNASICYNCANTSRTDSTYGGGGLHHSGSNALNVTLTNITIANNNAYTGKQINFKGSKSSLSYNGISETLPFTLN